MVCMRYCVIVAALNAIPVFVFEQIGDFSYFWAMVRECGPDLGFFLIGLCVGGFLLYLSVEFLE